MSVKPEWPPAQVWTATEAAVPTNTGAAARELTFTADAMNVQQAHRGQPLIVTAVVVRACYGRGPSARPGMTVTRAAFGGEETGTCRGIAIGPALRRRVQRQGAKPLVHRPRIGGACPAVQPRHRVGRTARRFAHLAAYDQLRPHCQWLPAHCPPPQEHPERPPRHLRRQGWAARPAKGRTDVTDMPSALHQLMGSVTGNYTVVAEYPRPGGIRPSVWEIQGLGGERWFAKQHAGPKLHQREVDAYRKWTVSLGAGRAPELVASDTQARTVLVTAVPGRSLDSLRLPAEQERKAYEQAGELLALHHAAAADEPTMTGAEVAWAATVARVLRDGAPYVPANEIAMVRWLTAQAPPRLPRVAAHGDYMPKNWLWHEAEQRLRVIDFERAELQPAARRDFPRLRYRLLFHQPNLNAALHHGYGRQLTEEELVACRAYGALDALDSLAWGIKHRDLGLVDEAHTMLESLRLENHRRVWGGWRS